MQRWSTFFSIILIFFSLVSCSSNGPKTIQITHVKGNTMGTTYQVSVTDSINVKLKPSIDSLLLVINKSMSTYDPTSLISRVNEEHYKSMHIIDDHFFTVFSKAKKVYNASEGAFDPCVMPLVNFWGFGHKQKSEIDTTKLDSLLLEIVFDEFHASQGLIRDSLSKPEQRVFFLERPIGKGSLDFSAIAKGYAVDEVAKLLEAKGCSNFYVEIGGEVRTKGTLNQGEVTGWPIQIEIPSIDGNPDRKGLQALLLVNQAVATSGNYRNHKIHNGQKLVHTINPSTGKPELSNLLSVSIVADDCMLADAYATACMVMGVEQAYEFISTMPDVEAYFIYSNEDKLTTKYTAGFPIH